MKKYNRFHENKIVRSAGFGLIRFTKWKRHASRVEWTEYGVSYAAEQRGVHFLKI